MESQRIVMEVLNPKLKGQGKKHHITWYLQARKKAKNTRQLNTAPTTQQIKARVNTQIFPHQQ